MRTIKRRYRKLIRAEIEKTIGHLIADVEKHMCISAEGHALVRLKQTISDLNLFKDKICDLEQEIINKSIRPRDWLQYRMNIHIQEKEPYHCYWIGADVYITTGPVKNYTGSKIVCVTPHADMLTRLFRRIALTDLGAINYINKYEFYGRMAEAVIIMYENGLEPSFKEVWLEAIGEAKILLNNWLADLKQVLNEKEMKYNDIL